MSRTLPPLSMKYLASKSTTSNKSRTCLFRWTQHQRWLNNNLRLLKLPSYSRNIPTQKILYVCPRPSTLSLRPSVTVLRIMHPLRKLQTKIEELKLISLRRARFRTRTALRHLMSKLNIRMSSRRPTVAMVAVVGMVGKIVISTFTINFSRIRI